MNKYYQQELMKLRELAKEFASVHPAAAPMLGQESSDPDVERLLEGVAFLNGQLYQKIDDDFPEIIHSLTDIIFPHFLRPVPSMSLVRFTPKPSLMGPLEIPRNTTLASNMVGNTRCLFQTTMDLTVPPLKLTKVSTSPEGAHSTRVSMSFELTTMTLPDWTDNRIVFFLSGPYAQACNTAASLSRDITSIEISAPDMPGSKLRLKPSSVRNLGFDSDNILFPYPEQSFSGYRLLQEYFTLPQKFLFFEITGFSGWKTRGEGSCFDVDIFLKKNAIPHPDIKTDNIDLFVTPAINTFSYDADPVILDYRKERIPVRPSGSMGNSIQIYSVDQVSGYAQGSVTQKDYLPLDLFAAREKNQVYYQVIRKPSVVHDSYDVSLALSYGAGLNPGERETVTMSLTCTHGKLPEKLKVGDICCQTSDSPELVEFSNLTVPTAQIDPPITGDSLWRLLSHLSLNIMSIGSADALKTLLRLYIFPKDRDKSKMAANIKRIDGILGFSITPGDRIIKGMPIRGSDITMTARKDHFASTGDLILFGSVIDEFLSQYFNFNSYTRLTIHETISGETFSWPMRIGNRLMT